MIFSITRFLAEDKNDARNLLRDMLGFTRHERLDVKKPGPPAAPPPPSSSAEQIPKAAINKEILPAHLRGEILPKVKKLVSEHGDDTHHGSYSVDPQYTHVILKNP